jgi:hypothetical protein
LIFETKAATNLGYCARVEFDAEFVDDFEHQLGARETCFLKCSDLDKGLDPFGDLSESPEGEWVRNRMLFLPIVDCSLDGCGPALHLLSDLFSGPSLPVQLDHTFFDGLYHAIHHQR